MDCCIACTLQPALGRIFLCHRNDISFLNAIPFFKAILLVCIPFKWVSLFFLLILNDYCIQYIFLYFHLFIFFSFFFILSVWWHFLFIGNIKWRQISHCACVYYCILDSYIGYILLAWRPFRWIFVVCIVNSSHWKEGYL